MRFLYTLFDNTGTKEDEFIKLSTRVADGWKLQDGYTLKVEDQLLPKTSSNSIFFLLTQDEIDEFLGEQEIAESRAMQAIHDGAIQDYKMMDKVKWDPFKDAGITVRDASIPNNLPDANPKTAAAASKPKTSGVPPVAIMALGAAMQNGVDKYGKFNWRDTGVTASVFYDAMMRHLNEWYAGEDFTSDSKVHHLAHLMAGAAIILDATQHGKLNDDRSKAAQALDQASVYKTT